MDAPEEKPWNEAQWERFLQRSEARSARYGELLETLIDHPNQEQIIAKEMGWDWLADAEESGLERDVTNFDTQSDAGVTDRSDLAEPVGAADEALQDDAHDESPFGSDGDIDDSGFADAELDSPRLDRKQIPAYNLAYEVGLQVHQTLKPFLEKLDLDGPLDDAGERLVSAYTNSLIPAAKITAGNGMGYEDESLCGHIVIVRKGLAACVTAIEDLAWLKANNGLPPEVAAICLSRLEAVRQAIDERIAELRASVWWD